MADTKIDLTPELELRSVDKLRIELRADGDEDEQNTAVGYGAVFNSRADIGGMFTEEVASVAFNKTIQEANIRASFNHDYANQLLGTTRSGTVQLTLDERGLQYEIDLPNTGVGRDVKELLRRGDVTGSSWLGYVLRDSWFDLEAELPHRVIEEIRLVELGPVTAPAYEDSTAALRSLQVERSDGEASLQKARDALPKKYYRF